MSEFHFNFLEGIVLAGVPNTPLNAPIPALCMDSLIIKCIQVGEVTGVVPPACMTSSRALVTHVYIVIATIVLKTFRNSVCKKKLMLQTTITISAESQRTRR